jgi:hypothetical protein
LVHRSSGNGAHIILVVKVQLVQEQGLDPFHDAFDIGLAAAPRIPSFRACSASWGDACMETIRMGVPGERTVIVWRLPFVAAGVMDKLILRHGQHGDP